MHADRVELLLAEKLVLAFSDTNDSRLRLVDADCLFHAQDQLRTRWMSRVPRIG